MYIISPVKNKGLHGLTKTNYKTTKKAVIFIR